MPFLCGFILTSILFFPPFTIKSGAPAVEIIDFLLPVLAIVIFFMRREIDQRRWLLLVLGFGGFILLTMVINSRLSFVSDYFEIYKIFKFLILICLFSLLDTPSFCKKWINPLFAGLVFFNLLHYFNIFNFNIFLEQFYFGHNHYLEFGINSAGIPNSKRMMGFTANPNNNAMIFSLFAIYFLPKNKADLKSFAWFGIAALMLFLCQSRTAMLAFPCILIGYAVLNGKQWQRTVTAILVSCAIFFLSYGVSIWTIGVGTPVNKQKLDEFIAAHPEYSWDEKSQQLVRSGAVEEEFTYLESVVHGQFTEGTSMVGRYEIWQHLWGMIKSKPVFGHGPYKEYFYDNQLYAENEFIFMAWRYGFTGLGIYLIILGWLVVLAYRNRFLESAVNLLLFLILFCIVSLTNLPFSATSLNMLFAVLVGLFFAELHGIKKSDAIR